MAKKYLFPEADRRLCILYLEQGLTLSHIAKKLGISLSTLSRATKNYPEVQKHIKSAGKAPKKLSKRDKEALIVFAQEMTLSEIIEKGILSQEMTLPTLRKRMEADEDLKDLVPDPYSKRVRLTPGELSRLKILISAGLQAPIN